jgi:pimeloyl-ACP methyl ester carboxylesterase
MFIIRTMFNRFGLSIVQKKNFMNIRYIAALILWMGSSVAGFGRPHDPVDYLNTPNRFLEVGGVKFAYRKLGKESEYPLVLLQHSRGTMDNWDPALIDALAADRTVIVFDNKGVGLSEGKTPATFEAMGDDAADFIAALGYKQVDVLGFSIGGAVAQTLTVRHPGLVHKLILAGTAPKGGAKINERDPKILEIMAHPRSEAQVFLATFYAPTPLSQQLGEASLARRHQRSAVYDKAIGTEAAQAQNQAREAWGMPADSTFAYLQKIAIPVLVANGSDDIMMFTVNSVTLYRHLPDARLILYPNSAHGFLFQYPVQVARDAGDFLDNDLK